MRAHAPRSGLRVWRAQPGGNPCCEQLLAPDSVEAPHGVYGPPAGVAPNLYGPPADVCRPPGPESPPNRQPISSSTGARPGSRLRPQQRPAGNLLGKAQHARASGNSTFTSLVGPSAFYGPDCSNLASPRPRAPIFNGPPLYGSAWRLLLL